MASKNLKNAIFEIIDKSQDIKAIKLLSLNEKNLLIKIFIYGRSENYLYQYISTNKIQYLFSKKILSKLKKRCHINNLKKSSILLDCAKVFKILDENSIQYIPLKGMHINMMFKNLSNFRQIRDIDILIKKNDIQKVFYLLQDIGYKTKFHSYKSQRNISLITGDKYDLERLYSPNGTCLEVHHKILKNNKKNDLFDSCFNQAHFKTKTAIYPDIELLIIHLIYHSSSKQGFDVGVQGLIDINELINDPTTDLNKLIDISIQHNLYAELMCFIAIYKKYINKKILKKIYIPHDFDHTLLNNVIDLIFFNKASNASIKFFQSSSIKNFLVLYKRENLLDGVVNKNYIFYFIKKLFYHVGLFFLFVFKAIFVKDFLKDNTKSIKILNKLNHINVSNYKKR